MAETHSRLFYRLTLNQRIQHVMIMVTFSVQILTGFPLKFAGSAWAYPLNKLFGGVFMAGRIHRVSGVIMVLTFFYTGAYIIWTTIQKIIIVFREQPAEDLKDAIVKIAKVVYYLPIFPRVKDGKDILDALMYFFFLSDKKPDYDKFTWKEKFDFLAVFWGIPVFAMTGPILWFPSFWTTIGLPPVFINVALIAHSDEALLAMVVVFVWHFYDVIFCPEKFPMDGLLLSGVISEHHMAEEHPAEYRRILMDEGEDSSSIVRPEE